MVHLNMINMVDVENGIHSLEPGLFSQGCLEKGYENFRLFSFSYRGKNYKTFRNNTEMIFFYAFFILKFAANGKGRKAAN